MQLCLSANAPFVAVDAPPPKNIEKSLKPKNKEKISRAVLSVLLWRLKIFYLMPLSPTAFAFAHNGPIFAIFSPPDQFWTPNCRLILKVLTIRILFLKNIMYVTYRVLGQPQQYHKRCEYLKLKKRSIKNCIQIQIYLTIYSEKFAIVPHCFG